VTSTPLAALQRFLLAEPSGLRRATLFIAVDGLARRVEGNDQINMGGPQDVYRLVVDLAK
jgi:hypothetical protein